MNSEVFIANADGCNRKNLTNHLDVRGLAGVVAGRQGGSPSPAIAATPSYQIFVMNADGSNVRLLANTEGRGTAPKWAPDGKTIYFTNCWKPDYRSACEITRRRPLVRLDRLTPPRYHRRR